MLLGRKVRSEGIQSRVSDNSHIPYPVGEINHLPHRQRKKKRILERKEKKIG